MNVFGLWEEAVVPRKNPLGCGEDMLMLTPPRKASGDSRPEPSCCEVTTPPKKIKTCTVQFNLFALLLQSSDVEWWYCNNSRPLWGTSVTFILSIRDIWRTLMVKSIILVVRGKHARSSSLTHTDLARVCFYSLSSVFVAVLPAYCRTPLNTAAPCLEIASIECMVDIKWDA